MAKVKIFKQDGTPTPYFYWSGEVEHETARVQVYKHGSHGVTRMKGVFFDPAKNTLDASSRDTGAVLPQSIVSEG